MLEVASGKFRPDERVEFQPADAMALPFPDSSFDVVVCQFGGLDEYFLSIKKGKRAVSLLFLARPVGK
jgi:hypothetical protein